MKKGRVAFTLNTANRTKEIKLYMREGRELGFLKP